MHNEHHYRVRSPSALAPLVGITETLQPDEIECVHALCLHSDVRTFTVQFHPDDEVSEAELSALDEVTEATLLGETGDRIIYQITIELEESVAAAFTAEGIDGAQLESATISNNRWKETKLFKNYETFNEFRASCEDNDISLDLVSITPDPSVSDEPSQDALTERQREALTLALSRGYYESPRQVTAEELAEEFGISQPSLSSLLRRGERRLLTASLGSEAQLHTLPSERRTTVRSILFASVLCDE